MKTQPIHKKGHSSPPPLFGACLLWPVGLMDQDATWCGSRPWPRPHCVRRERAPPQKGAQSPIFRPVCCGQTAGWIKMPLGREVGYRPGDIMLHGNPAPLLKEGHNSPRIFGPCLLWQNGWMDQDATWYRGRPMVQATYCVTWGTHFP